MGKIADVLQARGELDEALRIRRSQSAMRDRCVSISRRRPAHLKSFADMGGLFLKYCGYGSCHVDKDHAREAMSSNHRGVSRGRELPSLKLSRDLARLASECRGPQLGGCLTCAEAFADVLCEL